ncbi:MAG: hypothetical protein EOP06_22180 [Proteobacteria bacterium]|nr:MAG: hypothetical protein EOP06_22180 [Pseudomonadota bacterium]
MSEENSDNNVRKFPSVNQEPDAMLLNMMDDHYENIEDVIVILTLKNPEYGRKEVMYSSTRDRAKIAIAAVHMQDLAFHAANELIYPEE